MCFKRIKEMFRNDKIPVVARIHAELKQTGDMRIEISGETTTIMKMLMEAGRIVNEEQNGSMRVVEGKKHKVLGILERGIFSKINIFHNKK